MFLKTYQSILSEIEELLRVAYLIRISIGMSILGAITLLLTDQSMEILRVLAEDRRPLGLAFFALATFFLSFMAWYWARVLLYVFEPLSFEQKSVKGWAVRNLPRICGVVPFIAVVIAAYRVINPRPYVPETRDTQVFLIVLLIASIFAAILLYLFFLARRRVIKQSSTRHARIRQLRSSDPLTQSRRQIRELSATSKIVLSASILLGVIFFILFSTTAGQVLVAPTIGPAAIVLLCVGTVIPFGSMLVYFGKLSRIPLLTLLVIAAMSFSALDLNDNHMIRYGKQAKRNLPQIDQAFTEWLRNRGDLGEYKDKKKPYPVFIVSAEGGGLRAAYFTALTLSAMQDRSPTFAQHVFAISSVSGGSVGATVFAGLAARYAKNQAKSPGNQNPPDPPRLQDKADAILRRDFLSPLLAAGLYPDLAQRFLPFAINRFDRARALEKGVEHAWTSETEGGRELSRPFYQLWKDFPRGAVPALFINTTRVETGERMVISNLSTRNDPEITWIENLTDTDASITLPLSTAACLSARFPFITPAGHLIKNDKEGRTEKYRFVDGGYFESSGTATLLDIFTSIRSSKVGEQVPFKIIMIRIGFAPSPRTKYLEQGLSEVMSPFRTLLNTREARGATAIRQLKTMILPLKETRKSADMISFELREDQVPLPLGWLLSNKSCLEMKRQLKGMQGVGEVAKQLE